MPLYPHHRHSISDAGHGQTQDNFYSVANALYQSGQTLASAAIPSHQPWQANRPAQPIAQPPIPQNPYTTGNTQGLPYSNGGISRRSSLRYAPPQYQNQQGLGLQPSAMDQYGQHMSFQGNNLNIQGDPASPNRPGGGAGGGHARQMSMGGSSNIQQHNLPQISTQLHQPPVSSARPPPNHAHSFSNSSPGNMDPATPMYKAYASASTPDTTQKFMSPTSRGPPSSVLSPSYSPLGLADIRSRTDTLMNDVPFSTAGTTQMEEQQYPTNSNYLAPWPIFAVDWCKWPPKSSIAAGKIAIGSYLEDNHNYIQILESHRSPPDPDNRHAERGLEFVKTAQANHSYPVTRILWEPPSSNKQSTDLLATSGDHLRLWSLPSATSSSYSNSISRTTNQREAPLQELSPLALLSNSKSTEHTAPITSLDWNVVQPSLIITSSIDTTCTIWDIPTLTAKTQLIAHDKEVFDVKFCANSVDVFVSCGADGSVRMFDLRSLEHSTIIYEPSEVKADGKAGNFLSFSPSTTKYLLISSTSVITRSITGTRFSQCKSQKCSLPSTTAPSRCLSPRRPSPSHLLSRITHHPCPGRPATRPSPARTQRSQCRGQLHRMVSHPARPPRIRRRRQLRPPLGSPLERHRVSSSPSSAHIIEWRPRSGARSQRGLGRRLRGQQSLLGAYKWGSRCMWRKRILGCTIITRTRQSQEADK